MTSCITFQMCEGRYFHQARSNNIHTTLNNSETGSYFVYQQIEQDIEASQSPRPSPGTLFYITVTAH